MARAADTEDLEIDATRGFDFALVTLAHGADVVFGRETIGNMRVRRIDINAIEEMLAHEAVVTLQIGWLHRPVFVEVEGDDVLERQAFFTMESHELVVHAGRRRTSREAEDALFAGASFRANEVGDFARDGGGDVLRALDDAGRNLLGR